MAKHFGCARHVYNWGLAEKKKHYETTGKGLSKRQLQVEDRSFSAQIEVMQWLWPQAGRHALVSQGMAMSILSSDK